MATAARPCSGLFRNASRIQSLARSSRPAPSPGTLTCIRSFNNTTPIIEGDGLPPDPPVQTPQPGNTFGAAGTPRARNNALYTDPFTPVKPARRLPQRSNVLSPRYDLNRAPTSPVNTPTTPLQLSPAVRQYLPHLTSQPPFYITIHIHGKPYLVTAGDTVRLPFLMHGVMPGDVLRLDRASILGSREWTLRAGNETSHSLRQTTAAALGPQDAPSDPESEPLGLTEPIIGKTADLPTSPENTHQTDPSTSQLREQRPKRRNKPTYLDPRLFVCRATVVGTESEPMRIKEKTKQRQRHVKHVYSKMRYTILRISEITVKSVEELEMAESGAAR